MTETRVADPLIGGLVDGRYRVVDRVARGGMATVYLATDERLERTVALKIVHPAQEAPDRELSVDRFIDEAKAIARLAHPNVVAAYDHGTHDGLPYLVMEYVPGRTLRDVLSARRRLTPVEALAITEQMLAAIAAAHRAGLVHRDIKPENVLVAEAPSGGVTNLVDSVVKVADFGLAQAVAAASDAAADPAADESLLATAAYVPPELVRDGRADARSDVYSVGIVLFEMLTGKVPFDDQGGTGPPADVAWQHVTRDVPPPSARVSGLPRNLDDLVERATRRDPAQRPTDAGALLAEVQVIREQVTTAAVRRTAGGRLSRSGAVSARPGSADETALLPPVPGSERPAWARLPSAPSRSRSRAAAPDRPRRARSGDGQDHSSPQLRIMLVALAAVLVLLLGAGGWWLGLGRWMPAPDLVGMAGPAAAARAAQQGLDVDYTAPVHDAQVPVDHVVRQEPAADGRVARGGTIMLTLSRGPERFEVLDVIGAETEVAIRQLEALGLVVVEGEPGYSNTVPAGRVMAVEPGVGEEVAAGDTVTITVSEGRPPIDVPAVIGRHVNEATQILQQEGLVVTTEEVEDDEPAGTVVDQDPEASTGAEPGDTVHLQVSKGPPTVPVPNVTNRNCDRAIQILEEAGFEVALGFEDDGRVLLQNPSAGTGLRPGSTVTIFCG